MNVRRRCHVSILLLITLLFSAMLVSGCFDYREEIFINPDMTGTITMDVTIGELFVDLYEQSGVSAEKFSEEAIRKKIDAFKGVTLISLNTFTAEENRRIQLTMKFDSVKTLGKLFDDPDAARFLGTLAISPDKKGLNYTRTIALKDSTIAGLALYDEKRSQRFWVSKVHFPGYIQSTNAPEKNVDEKTQSIVIWGYAIDVLLAEPRSMEAVFSKPSAVKPVPLILAGIVFVAVLIGLYKILGKLEKRAHTQHE